MKKILTIAIPTYNGEHFIANALESVLSQLTDQNKDSIDILVLDNKSTDNTGAIVNQFQKKFPSLINYVCNQKNIGYDRNIDKIFHIGESEFVKILADDDALYPGSLQQHLNLIKTCLDVDCFQMNFDVYNTELDHIINKLDVNNKQDVYCLDGDQFLIKGCGRFGQVSSLMIRRKKWLENDPTEGYDTNYIHVFMIFKIIDTGISYISALPMIKVRTGSPNFETNSDNSILVSMGSIKIYKYFIKYGKYKKEYKFLLSEQIKYCAHKIINAKINGLKRPINTFTKIFINYYNSLFYWTIFFPLLIIPSIIYKIISKVNKSYKKIKTKSLYYLNLNKDSC